MPDQTHTLSIPEHWRYSRNLFTVLGIGLALLAGWLIGSWGVFGALVIVGVPVALLAGIGILLEPKIGLLIYVNLSFLIGFSRFLTADIALGTALDGLLVLTLLSTFLNGRRMDWRQLRRPAFWILIVWVSFTILEYFNPEHPFPPAWFYHVRSFSLSWFLIAIIVSVNPIKKSDIKLFCIQWIVWSFFAALWGFKQQYIGLEAAELRWLAEGAAKQHILWANCAVFPFTRMPVNLVLRWRA